MLLTADIGSKVRWVFFTLKVINPKLIFTLGIAFSYLQEIGRATLVIGV